MRGSGRGEHGTQDRMDVNNSVTAQMGGAEFGPHAAASLLIAPPQLHAPVNCYPTLNACCLPQSHSNQVGLLLLLQLRLHEHPLLCCLELGQLFSSDVVLYFEQHVTTTHSSSRKENPSADLIMAVCFTTGPPLPQHTNSSSTGTRPTFPQALPHNCKHNTTQHHTRLAPLVNDWGVSACFGQATDGMMRNKKRPKRRGARPRHRQTSHDRA